MNKKVKDIKQVKIYKAKFITSIIILDIITVISLYLIMPIIQGYPPFSDDLAFQKKVQVLTHIQQYTIVLIIGIALNITSMKIYMKNIYAYMNKYYRKEEIDYSEIVKTRRDCINVPYKLAIFELIGIALLGLILNFIMLAKPFAILKFTLMIMSLASITALMILIVSQKFFYEVMESTYKVNNKYEMHNGIRIKNSLSLQIQILPFIVVVLIIISLIGYSKAMDKHGNAISNYYEAYIEAKEDEIGTIDKQNLIQFLDRIPLYDKSNYYFIIEPEDSNIYISNPNGSISSFVIDYRDFFYSKTKGRLYERFGIDEQLYAKKTVDDSGRIWYIGFKFEVVDYSLFTYYMALDAVVLVLYLIISYIWAKTETKNANRISKNLKAILDSAQPEKINELPIMSNDEFGDLSYYYNKIQEKLNEKQAIISIQTKFATIGEMATLMAHDINNPASSLDASIELLNNIKVEESKQEQYQKLLNNMRISNDKILKVVNDTQGQFKNASDTNKRKFSLQQLLTDLSRSEENEIAKVNGKINIRMHKEIMIYGVESKLYQVIMNIVRNAILSYRERGIQGDVNIYTSEDIEEYTIAIEDKAGGIPKEIIPTLFKKILTTRGTKGTGLGLYLSAGIIKGDFKGELTFETDDKGTTFYINLPKNEEEQK